MIDFSGYKFRASQAHLLTTGTIGITDNQEEKLQVHLQRRRDFRNGVNKAKPLTDNMKSEAIDLLLKKRKKELPKTMTTSLRKVHRAERHNRNFVFTNKYTQKGLKEEEEATTVLQIWLGEFLNKKVFFSTKEDTKVWLFNDWFTGTPDLVDTNDFNNCNEGYDTKCSWNLDSFPYPEDELDGQYDWQNQVYMNLTGARIWHTAYCLVNASEEAVNNEKLKWFYALQHKEKNPDDPASPFYDEYVEKCKEVERMMIFDYDRFTQKNNHIMEYSREEWMSVENPVTGHKGLDIPLENRVILKTVEYDESKIDFLKERVEIARNYLAELEKQTLSPWYRSKS